MKIALVTPVFATWGWWLVLEELSKRHDLTVFTPKPNCMRHWGYQQLELDKTIEHARSNIQYNVIDMEDFWSTRISAFVNSSHPLFPSTIRVGLGLTFDLSLDGFGVNLYRALSKSNYDILFTMETFLLGSFISALVSKKCGACVVIKQARDHPKQPIIPWFKGCTLKSADRFIVETDEQRRALMREGVSAKKIDKIPKPIDLKRFHPNLPKTFKKVIGLKDEPIVLYVGRFSRVKGLEYLVAAFPMVLKRFANSKLVLVGDGPRKEKLKKKIRKLGIDGNVILVDPIRWDNIHEVYPIADVYVQPSLSEQSCTAILEAMASGVPVVASNVGGIPEVTGSTVFLVEPKKEKILAKAIIAVLSNEDLAQTLIRREKEEIEKKHSVKEVSGLFEEVFIKATGHQ